jgi:predicted AAA+ superfamily ATPase
MQKRYSKISLLLKKKQSVLILGPRGTGKSYYINHLLKSSIEHITIDLLDTEAYDQFLKNPGMLSKIVTYKLESEGNIVIFIDEVQKVPALLNEVHRLIETVGEQVVFILTGSSARKLKKSHANLLAGRAIYIPFFPFNILEVDFIKYFNKVMQYGTLPTAFLENDIDLVESYLRTYTHIYLKEEIQQESLTRNIEIFSRFLEFAAFENGNPVNYSKIAKQLGVSLKTVQGHYQILEDTLIITKIPAWTFSIRKQMIQMPKYYLFDNGILNSLTGELKTDLKEASYRFGNLFENLIVNEIIRYNALMEFDYKIYHYRTNHGVEIDLILQKSIKYPPVAVEIKSSKNLNTIDIKQLKNFKEEFPEARCYVLCRILYPYKEGDVTFLPFQDGIKQIFCSDGG